VPSGDFKLTRVVVEIGVPPYVAEMYQYFPKRLETGSSKTILAGEQQQIYRPDFLGDECPF